jgi:hypothetical protein
VTKKARQRKNSCNPIYPEPVEGFVFEIKLPAANSGFSSFSMWKKKTLPVREPTNEASAETKLVWAMPCKEEEDDSQ